MCGRMHCDCSSYDVLAISGLDADWLSKAYCGRILEIESGSSVSRSHGVWLVAHG